MSTFTVLKTLDMKKLCMLTVSLLTVCVTYAQIKQGTTLLGGDLLFSRMNTWDDGNSHANTTTSIYISPSVGRAIGDDLVAGIAAGYGQTTAKTFSQSPFIFRTKSYGVNLFVRRYRNVAGGLSVFLEAALQGQYTDQTQTDRATAIVNQHTKIYTATLGLDPGLAYAVSSRLWLEAGFQNLLYAQYQHNRTTAEGAPGSKQDIYNIGSLLGSSGVSLGFRFLFNQ